jgi:hypothetical protein
MNAAQVILDIVAIFASGLVLVKGIEHKTFAEFAIKKLQDDLQDQKKAILELRDIVINQPEPGLQTGIYMPKGKPNSEGEQEFHKMVDFKELDDIIKGTVS